MDSVAIGPKAAISQVHPCCPVKKKALPKRFKDLLNHNRKVLGPEFP